MAVLLYAADAQFVVERLVEPHFGVGFGDVVVNPGGEILDVFCRPTTDQFALLVLAPADADTRGDGSVLFNEINTLPGFTSISMYPKMMVASGLSYCALITRLIELGVQPE